ETVYLKTVNDAAKFEAALTAFLAREFPEITVEPLAVDLEKNWMLMRELPGRSLRDCKTMEAYTSFIRSYAEFQQQTISLTEKLLSLGTMDRRLPVLKLEIQEHLEALCTTGLNEEETAEILALKPELLDMCDEMTGVLPDTLDHGDLHSANVFVQRGKFRIFDWGDASVTHPFLSVRVFWNSLGELLEEDTDEKWMRKISEFRPVYLEKWREFAPADVLAHQLYLAEQVGCVYRALSWYLYITPYRVDQEESYNKPSQWLQLLLDHRKLL
ncbi:MAG TPA: phosphotransferase, partial [Bacillales bacterium]|nr:phosphotransferase [Bacillales bacterium]